MKTARIVLFHAAVLLVLASAPARGQIIDYIETFNGQNTLTNVGQPGDVAYIFGSGFAGQTLYAITFDGVSATTGLIVADTEIQTQIPTGATNGLVGVYFDSGAEVVFSPFEFIVIGSGPYVTGFSPDRGGGSTLVTIEGFGFTDATNVFFNGVAGTNGFIQSDTQISIYPPAIVTSGPITVASPDGTFTTSSNFFVPSVITSFSPLAGAAGANVVIEGANFTGATAVFFNGLPAASFTVNSSSNITAVVPTGATTGPISLLAPAGGYVTSTNFTILPSIFSFSPVGGTPGTIVSISGLNFGTTGVTVEFNGLAAVSPANNGGTNITVTVPGGATTGPITVVNSAGSAVTTNLFYLAPTLDTVAPNAGPVGTTVIISGQNLTGVTNVEFGALSAAFTVNSATTITATVPNGILSGPVVVGNPGGSAPAATAPVYFYGPPDITSVSTNAGPAGALVTISGLNFLGAAKIAFGGVAATNFTVLNNSNATARVPDGVLTGPVSITGLGGSFTTAALFYGPPAITSFSPGSGLAGDEITITGVNFTGLSSVKFGPAGAAGYSLVDADTIQAAVPAGAVTGVISVATPAGNASSSTAFAAGAVLLTPGLSPEGKVTVAWPLALSGWVLQTSGSLGPGAAWTNSSAPVSMVGNQNVATVQSAPGAAQFYRLKN